MNNKIIFLDVDGVLNSMKFDRWLQDHHMKQYYGYELLDQNALLNLKDIVFVTGADIILSSSWRLSNKCCEELRQQLLPYGLRFIDKTVCLCQENRGEEIKEWLSRHPEVDHFVILDDEDEFKDDLLKNNFVETTFEEGLLEQHAAKAIEILTKSTNRAQNYNNMS